MIQRKKRLMPYKFDMGGITDEAFFNKVKGRKLRESDWVFGNTKSIKNTNVNTNVNNNIGSDIGTNVDSSYLPKTGITNKLNYTFDVKPGTNMSFEDMFNSTRNFQNNVNSALTFKDKIAEVESSTTGGYNAYNEHTGATGKYQFLPRYFRDVVKNVLGISWSEFAKCPECQERLMDYHINTNLVPSSNRLEQQFPNSGLNKNQLMALVHFKGEAGARKELSDPQLMTQRTKTNISSVNYLKRF